jgi:hypothetical protein
MRLSSSIPILNPSSLALTINSITRYMLHVEQIEWESKIAKARLESDRARLLLLLVTVLPQALFALVGCNFMSFTFFTAGHFGNYLWVFTQGLLRQSRKIWILRLDGDLRH